MDKNIHPAPQLRSIHCTVSSTEYIVTGSYAPAARETASKKIERLLLQDAQSSGMIPTTVLRMAAQKKGVQYD